VSVAQSVYFAFGLKATEFYLEQLRNCWLLKTEFSQQSAFLQGLQVMATLLKTEFSQQSALLQGLQVMATLLKTEFSQQSADLQGLQVMATASRSRLDPLAVTSTCTRCPSVPLSHDIFLRWLPS
jgi:hypothetical protein